MNLQMNTEASNLMNIAEMYLLREDSKRLELSKASYVFVLKAFEDSKEVYWIDEDDNDEVVLIALMKNEDIEKELVKVSSNFLHMLQRCYRNEKQSYYENYSDACVLCKLELEKLTK